MLLAEGICCSMQWPMTLQLPSCSVVASRGCKQSHLALSGKCVLYKPAASYGITVLQQQHALFAKGSIVLPAF